MTLGPAVVLADFFIKRKARSTSRNCYRRRDQRVWRSTGRNDWVLCWASRRVVVRRRLVGALQGPISLNVLGGAGSELLVGNRGLRGL